MQRRSLVLAGVGLMASAGSGTAAQADDASRPLRMVVPFGPGSGLDAIGRALAQTMGKNFDSAVIVENREGAAGAIGARAVAGASADGHTLLLAANPPFAVMPILQKQPSYDPIQDFTPIARIAEMPMVLVASRHSPLASFSDMTAYAKANPGKLNYASAGVGVPSHLFMEQLKKSLGLDLTFVPYKSTGQMYTDVISGQVPLATVSLSVAKPQLDAGTWKALAIGLPRRHKDFPDIPTIGEVSPSVDLSNCMTVTYGLLGPRGLPAQELRKSYEQVAKATKSPEFSAVLQSQFAELALQGPEEFSATLAANHRANSLLIQGLGLAASM